MTAAETEFFVCTAAVNQVLGRASTRHRGQPCPGGSARARTGVPVVAYCDRGCFDEAVELLAQTLRRTRRARTVGRGDAVSYQAYANRVAAAALGDLHRKRRKELGLPQRPARIVDAEWAARVLPDRADRSLLAHMITWLGCDAPALDGYGWPVEAWARQYGRSATDMAATVDRVASALRSADARRYVRYVAVPLAAKPYEPVPFGTLNDSTDRAVLGAA